MLRNRLIDIVRSHQQERGAALLEAAMLLPVFVVLIIGTVTFSPLIIQYLQFTQLAHEGTRILANIPLLESTMCANNNNVTCEPVSGNVPAIASAYFSDYTGILRTGGGRLDITNSPPVFFAETTGSPPVTSPIPDNHRNTHSMVATLVTGLDLDDRCVDSQFRVWTYYDHRDGAPSSSPKTVWTLIECNYRFDVWGTSMIFSTKQGGPYLY